LGDPVVMVTLLSGLFGPFDLVGSLPSFSCWPCFAMIEPSSIEAASARWQA
jgi:hypothetical protein